MSPSVLFQSEDNRVVLIDVPKSIEEAQILSSDTDTGPDAHPLKRLVSAKPLDKPFKTPEPKQPSSGTPTESVSDLLALGAVTSALDILQKSYAGPWLLPRVVLDEASGRKEQNGSQKRKRRSSNHSHEEVAAAGMRPGEPIIPKNSTFLHGSICAERSRFAQSAPAFNLIVLDPPWPNRSARRNKKRNNYTVADDLGEIRETLSSIPVAAHLAPDGLVAVWITNKASVVGLMTGSRGVFHEWGLELLGEWTWLKVTTSGEPIVDINSRWRKPWERILIARKRGSGQMLPCREKVIVSVPDIHSRKPNLRGLFGEVFAPDYKGLEVFARNLTAGWWSWGNEVFKFQHPEHWVDP